jgi:hypothetical protein
MNQFSNIGISSWAATNHGVYASKSAPREFGFCVTQNGHSGEANDQHWAGHGGVVLIISPLPTSVRRFEQQNCPWLRDNNWNRHSTFES